MLVLRKIQNRYIDFIFRLESNAVRMEVVMEIIEITQENFEEEVVRSDKPVLIDFWADWCGPCQMLAPVVKQISEERNDIKVGKVNVDLQQELAMQFRVMSIPTLVVMKNGEETDRSVGLVMKDEICSML